MAAHKTILTCAVTGGGDTTRRNPAVPVTPEQISRSALEAADAGAAVVHIHVRDAETGLQSMDVSLYEDVYNRIRRANSNVIVNLTTGPGATYIPSKDNPQVAGPGSSLSAPERRVEHIVKLRPEICSLDLGTMNFHDRPYIVPPSYLREMAQMIFEAGVKPEMEAFDSGDVVIAQDLVKRGLVGEKPLIQFVLGVPSNAPATSKSLSYLSESLPSNFVWGGMGLSSRAFSMLAQSVLLGGHARIGLEDTLYIGAGELASSNLQLIEKAVSIIHALDGSLASPDEAREILGLRESRTP